MGVGLDRGSPYERAWDAGQAGVRLRLRGRRLWFGARADQARPGVPDSRFAGYDLFPTQAQRARANVEARGLAGRIKVEVADVAEGLPKEYDVISTYDVIHDAVDPVGLLKGIRKSLKPDGTYVCLDINCADKHEDNEGPLAAMFYGLSVLRGASPMELESPRSFDFLVYGQDLGTVTQGSDGQLTIDPDGTGSVASRSSLSTSISGPCSAMPCSDGSGAPGARCFWCGSKLAHNGWSGRSAAGWEKTSASSSSNGTRGRCSRSEAEQPLHAQSHLLAESVRFEAVLHPHSGWELDGQADRTGGTRRYWNFTVEIWVEQELPQPPITPTKLRRVNASSSR